MKNNLVMLSSLISDKNIFKIAILEATMKPSNSAQDYKSSQIKIDLNQVSMVDKVNLHKQIGEVIFSDLL